MTNIGSSKAKLFIEQHGWSWRESGTDHAEVETCPLCGRHQKFYMNIGGAESDGLWDCKVCNQSGSLYQLKQRLGETESNILSLHDASMARTLPEPLPDIRPLQRNLLTNEAFADVLDYLVAERGFSLATIEQVGLGAIEEFGKKWIVIPTYNKEGNVIFVKYRTVPPAKKEFRSCSGREATLYNGGCIVRDMPELIFVEGEFDAIACLSQGITGVVGVPGANVKKLSWLTMVDNAAPVKMYLLYDNDHVGQAAAKEMASRLGLDKTFNIVLPEFTTIDGKPGKDINEWFRAGHTLEEFSYLKANSKPFDVDGVKSIPDIIVEIQDDIEKNGEQRYALDTPWKPLTERLGGVNYGELIGIIANGKIGKTTLVENWLSYYAVEKDINCLMICLEMTQKELVRKWISHITQVETAKLTKADVLHALEIAQSISGDLLFGFLRAAKAKDVFDLIRQAVRRYGVKVVAFDNLQFLVRSLDHAAQETSNISKAFKELCMELNIAILLVVQPNRVKEGEIVSAHNSMNSSAIEKDVDAMIALHRNRVAKIKADEFKGFLEANENFEPQMLCRVDLSRYAPGGVCTLWMDGATSTVRDMTDNDKTIIQPLKTDLILLAPVSESAITI